MKEKKSGKLGQDPRILYLYHLGSLTASDCLDAPSPRTTCRQKWSYAKQRGKGRRGRTCLLAVPEFREARQISNLELKAIEFAVCSAGKRGEPSVVDIST